MIKEDNIIELKNLVKEYDSKPVLKNVNLKIKRGEFITLLGPSGSGKTTALRLIGGFEWPTRGEILINNRDVKTLQPYKRPVSTIFQDYALFPFLNVAKNIEYGLKIKRLPLKYPKKKHLDTLKIKEKEWIKRSKIKMNLLDIEQENYEATLRVNAQSSKKFKKAQKWLDDSDFKYSYWENYVKLKTQAFEKRYLSRLLTKKEINDRVTNIVKLVHLEGSEKKSIESLSGGMKQRVALARSLVTKPEILLLDEPFSAVDLKVSQQLQRELKEIQKNLNITFVLVTHNQEEALTLSDRVAIMLDGIIMQYGPPQQIYDYPINSHVASFIGESNLFKAKIIQKNLILWNDVKYIANTFNFKINSMVDVLIRPEDIELKKSNGVILGKVVSSIYQGTFWEYKIETTKFTFLVHSIKKFQIASEIYVKWINSDVHVMEQYEKN